MRGRKGPARPAVGVEWVRYGREAADRLRRAVADAKGDDPLRPVTVVVASNHVGVATRRLLASGVLGPVCATGVGIAAVDFLTVYRLAELLGAGRLAGAGRRPVSTPVVAAALRAALAAEPGLFAPVAEHPATEAALVAAYRELREVSPAALDRLAAGSERAADVVRLHLAARAALEPAWYDEQDLMSAAADHLRSDPAGATRDLGAVVVYLPLQLSRHATGLLAAMAGATGLTVLAGATGDGAADAEVGDAVARLVGDVPIPPTVDLGAIVDRARTRVVLASDADDEVRAAVRAVVAAVRDGTRLDRVAVLYASPEPYARLAHEHLAAAGIATNGPAVVPLAGRVAGRVLLDLLALPEHRFRRQDVFAWLASAPALFEGRWAPVAGWERVSREAGVVAGRADWDGRLAHLADSLDADAAALEARPDEQAPWKLDRARDQARRARELRTFVVGLIDDLEAAGARPKRWKAHARWARGHLHRIVGTETRRDDWPPAERAAAERVEAALDRLAALDPVEGPVPLDVFGRTLALELENDLGRVGRFGEGVFVAPVGMGIGLDLDLVVVLGLAEGSFPAPVRDDSLLPDHERERTGGELPLRRLRVERQHRDLLAAVAGARHHLLGVPRGDLRRSSERTASRWVLDVASTLAGTQWWNDDLLAAREPWLHHVASFDAGVRTLEFPATEQEHRLRTLMATGVRATGAGASAAGAHPADPVLAAGIEVVAARRSGGFTRFDGNVGGLPVPSPVDVPTSATRLETWSGCPFAYFVQHVLRVQAVEDPEDWLAITPIERGNLVHQALETFVTEVLARPEDRRPGPDDAWTAADRARLAEIGGELCREWEARGLTGRPLFWRRDRARILADLQRVLDEDDVARREARTRPVAAELSFGFPGDPVDAVPILLADGRAVRFRGKADRVDVAEDGTLHVTDYKTGSASGYRDIDPEDPAARGRHLQLAVYGAAARAHAQQPDAPVDAGYWFVSSRGGFERIGYGVDDGVIERVGVTLSAIVEGIEAGVFVPRPSDDASTLPWVECPACDPDALGTGELRRAWERKRSDPALVRYRDLAEPLEGGLEDEGAVDA